MNEEHVTQEKTLTISRETADRLYSLFASCEAADAHFKSCQSAQFRAHIQGAYKAANVHAAFNLLEEFIRGGG